MEKLKIREVDSTNAEILVRLCIPADRCSDPLFKKGMKAKKEWIARTVERDRSRAKLAFLGSEPVGLIQYKSRPEERLVEIECIFVPKKEHLGKGIGKSLLNALMEDVKSERMMSGGTPLALITSAFEVPGWFPQHEFYMKMGFKKVKENDPLLLYYPLEEDYVHVPKEERFFPQEEDRGKALVFYSPSCPWAIYFSEKIKESINEVVPGIPIRLIDMFWEQEEVRKRGKTPTCAVNGTPIGSFFMDKESFQKEVKRAVESRTQ